MEHLKPKKIKIEDKIKHMKDAKCNYPECDDKEFMSVSLHMVKKTESGATSQ